MQTLDAVHFDPVLGSWTPVASEPDVVQDRLRLVTYNIWFGDFRWRERLAALMDLIQACRPDVVALQEVTPRQLQRILAVPWVRRGYRVSDAAGTTLEPHGVLVLSRLPVRRLALCELPSDKSRKLLLAELAIGPRALRIGNIHLESSASATAVRLVQLDAVLGSLQEAPHTVLMGDFNFDPSQEAEQSQVEARFRDLWAELRGDEPGLTEDTANNPMRLLHKGKEKQVRFDRILLRSSDPGWAPQSIRLIGTDPISPDLPDVFPSDHFGLCGEIVWREAETTERP
jgi:tyrosyl-DNA phosphodiesterase 2